MGVLSNAAAVKVINYIFGLGADGPSYAAFYIALFKGNTEVSGTGYARQLTTPDTDYTLTGQVVSNDNLIDFGAAGSDWALSGDEITAYRIYDAVTAGNLVLTKDLAAPRIVANGDPVTIAIGALDFQVI